MYVFPVFLAGISFNFPLAVVLYWVTTNLWQSVQQYVMLRTAAEDEPARKGDEGKQPSTPPAAEDAPKGGSASSKPSPSSKNRANRDQAASKPKKKTTPSSGGSHLPRRKN
jgi:YidC/Oxa1 family membrane protein insertase